MPLVVEHERAGVAAQPERVRGDGDTVLPGPLREVRLRRQHQPVRIDDLRDQVAAVVGRNDDEEYITDNRPSRNEIDRWHHDPVAGFERHRTGFGEPRHQIDANLIVLVSVLVFPLISGVVAPTAPTRP